MEASVEAEPPCPTMIVSFRPEKSAVRIATGQSCSSQCDSSFFSGDESHRTARDAHLHDLIGGRVERQSDGAVLNGHVDRMSTPMQPEPDSLPLVRQPRVEVWLSVPHPE